MTTDAFLQELETLAPTYGAYLSAARRLEAGEGQALRPVRVFVLSSFTAETVKPYLVVEAARRGLRPTVQFGPFNQFETEILDPNSALYRFDPEVIVLALRLEDMAPALTQAYAGHTPESIARARAEVQQRLQGLIDGIRQHSPALVLLFNFAQPLRLDARFADAGLDVAQSVMVGQANEGVNAVCRAQPEVYVFDYARLTTEVGLERWYDLKLLYMARIPFGSEAQRALGCRLARYLRALLRPPCKCLVLDLDNTLWGGILGEDGIGGIQLGESYPGNVFKHFQQRLRSLRDQGLLLAIASKNNEEDVRQVFEQHADMVLRLDDFAAVQIHWQDKAGSLRAIAEVLNIGLDALAFFDDNPVERAFVQGQLPQVSVIDVPEEPLLYIRALEESGVFDPLLISDEDRRRSRMVQQSRQRVQFQTQAGSVEDFLTGLEMVATVGLVDPATLPRVVQLLGKTNQFNLTTRRHTGADLQDMIRRGGIALWMRLKDRFGDNGLIGVAIGLPQERGLWRIDSLLLSCRVLGRQAETALLSLLLQHLGARGATEVLGEYIPTAKNKQVAGFYARHQFQPTDEAGQWWRLPLKTNPISVPGFIRVVSQHEESYA